MNKNSIQEKVNMKQAKTDYTIQSLTQALNLLELFQGEIDELGVADLAKRLKLHKNKVIRLLATLETRGFIDRNRMTENFRLGLKTLELGQTYVRKASLKGKARPVLEQMAQACDETVLLAILKQDSVVYLDTVETTHAVRISPRVGSWLPACCTAAGKVQMAYQSDKLQRSVLSGESSRRFSPNTMIDRKVLQYNLGKIASLGYALEMEELEAGIHSVAAPIWDHTGSVAGAVSISVPATRIFSQRLESELIPLCRRGASDISARLGYLE